MVGVWQVRVFAPSKEIHGILGEMLHKRLIDSSICWVIHCQSVDRFEPFDVICDVGDRKAQHLCRRIATFNSTFFLEPMGVL